MNKSGVPYATHCLNTITGCLHGCSYCYAARMIRRYSTGKETGEIHVAPKGDPYPFGFDPTFHPHRLEEPKRVKEPCRIFLDDMGDCMGDWVPREWTLAEIEMMKETPWHTYLMLTKNPKRYREFDIPSNCWIGTTVEDQSKLWRADELAKVKASVRFLSLEPMQGRINLFLPTLTFDCNERLYCNHCCWKDRCDDPTHYYRLECPYCRGTSEGKPFAWVIVGAQSGTNAVPMIEDDVRCIRDQCVDAGVAFFYKQKIVNGRKVEMPELDGRKWDEYPRRNVLDA